MRGLSTKMPRRSALVGMTGAIVICGLLVGPGVADASSIGYQMTMPRTLNTGDSIDYGGRQLILQTDGNIVFYNNNVNPRKVCWTSHTSGSNRSHATLAWQTDGNLVEYNGSTVLWSSHGSAGVTYQPPGSTVDIENDSGKYNLWIGYSLFQTNC